MTNKNNIEERFQQVQKLQKVPKVPKKIYVDEDKYNRLKRVLEVMNVSITDYLDGMFTDFLDSLEDAVLSDNKELFLNVISKNIDEMQNEIQKEFER